MEIIISGAGGFLGGHLIERLLRNPKLCVTALSSQPFKLEKAFGDNKHFGVSEFENINWQKYDVLINCAFPRNTDGIYMADGLSYINKLLNAAAGKVKAIINISSQSVYSQTRLNAATENEPLNLETKYAVGKYAIELMINSLMQGIPHTNLRLASLIGEGFEQRIVNRLARQVKADNNICIKGGKQTFGFLDVRDAADAIAAMLSVTPYMWREVYNLGPEKNYSLLEIAECIVIQSEQHYNSKTTIQLDKSDEWHNSALDSSVFYEQFNWKPSFSLNETIEWILESQKETN